jgi:hypothetical protein
VPDDTALDFGTGDFSISFWVNAISQEAAFYPYARIEPPSEITISGESGTYTIACTDADGNTVTVSADYQFGKWEHYTIVCDRDGTLTVYKNSASVDSSDASGLTGTLNMTTPAIFGSSLDGFLDNLRIYKAALTSDEIATIYNNGKAKEYAESDTPTSGAASAAWNIDEGTGTTITDEISGLVGTFTGDVRWIKDKKKSGIYRGLFQ